jgi:transposase-like protein
MHEQIEARAALNGSGTAHMVAPAPEVETLPAPAPEVGTELPGGRLPSLLDAIMADPERREALRRQVMETTESIRDIAKGWGVNHETLRRRIKNEGWPRPAGAPKATRPSDGGAAGMRRLANSMADAGMVQARILRAVDRQIGKIDARLRKKGAEIEERDARILGNLAKTLGALTEIGSGGTTSKEMERPNRAEVEARLAERIRRWARGEEGSE